jgi:hypothetical protein
MAQPAICNPRLVDNRDLAIRWQSRTPNDERRVRGRLPLRRFAFCALSHPAFREGLISFIASRPGMLAAEPSAYLRPLEAMAIAIQKNFSAQ